METKKLSRQVRRRLNRKGITLASTTVGTDNVPKKSAANIHTSVTSVEKKKKTVKSKVENKAELEPVKTNIKPTVSPIQTSNRPRRPDLKNKVAYINTSYVSNDPNDIGGLIQTELIGLRKQAKNIKTASDLTEGQAHVIKRQITKLQGAESDKAFKRPKRDKTIGEAAEELAQLLKKQKAKLVSSSKSTSA